MIFVITGTQKFGFDRLLKAVDGLLAGGRLKEEVFAQTGHSAYVPRNYGHSPFLPMDEFNRRISVASLIISHCGGAAVNTSLKSGKTVIAVPRLRKHGEHVDDHQLEIAKEYGDANLLEVCYDIEKLDGHIEAARTKVFAKLEGSKSKIADIIERWLEGK